MGALRGGVIVGGDEDGLEEGPWLEGRRAEGGTAADVDVAFED